MSMSPKPFKKGKGGKESFWIVVRRWFSAVLPTVVKSVFGSLGVREKFCERRPACENEIKDFCVSCSCWFRAPDGRRARSLLARTACTLISCRCVPPKPLNVFSESRRESRRTRWKRRVQGGGCALFGVGTFCSSREGRVRRGERVLASGRGRRRRGRRGDPPTIAKGRNC